MSSASVIIRQVWAWNLRAEFGLIGSIVHHHPIVSIDSEYPGLITPHSYVSSTPFQNYTSMKNNVDNLNIIQIGLTLSDFNGNLPTFGGSNSYIWQFNFCDFDIDHDPHNAASIDLLRRQGTDLFKNKHEGIHSLDFAKELLISPLIFNSSNVTWVTFHGAYDFGFLIKILSGENLPSHVEGFMGLIMSYFGIRFYDMKHVMKYCKGLHGGLESVARTLSVERVAGRRHQAGSDSLLTLQTFLRLTNEYFNGDASMQHLSCVLYGLDVPTINFSLFQY